MPSRWRGIRRRSMSDVIWCWCRGKASSIPLARLPATLKDLSERWLRAELVVQDELSAQIRKIIERGNSSHAHRYAQTHASAPARSHRRGPRGARVRDSLGPPALRFRHRRQSARNQAHGGVRYANDPAGICRALGGLRTTDYFTGFQATGSLDRGRSDRTLERLPEGLTEFMCHPGKLGPELRGLPTRLKESREIELAALTSPEARLTIERRGIELVNYRDA